MCRVSCTELLKYVLPVAADSVDAYVEVRGYFFA